MLMEFDKVLRHRLDITLVRRCLDDDVKGEEVVCSAHTVADGLKHWRSSFPQCPPGIKMHYDRPSVHCAVLSPTSQCGGPGLNLSCLVQQMTSPWVLPTTLLCFFPLFFQVR